MKQNDHDARPAFSVIIPAHNEESLISAALEDLRRFGPEIEIIVVDGSSSDATAHIARQKGAKVVCCPRNRGLQCNAGAREARGGVLVFLYADTRLPDDAVVRLREAFDEPAVKAGVFRLSFDLDHWVLRFYSFCNRFDSVLTRFGDQCIVARRDFFFEIGGFPAWPLFDDSEFLRKARRLTRVRRFPSAIVTSSRKFRQNGMLRQYLHDAWLMVQYLFGASPFDLARKYYSGGGKT